MPGNANSAKNFTVQTAWIKSKPNKLKTEMKNKREFVSIVTISTLSEKVQVNEIQFGPIQSETRNRITRVLIFQVLQVTLTTSLSILSRPENLLKFEVRFRTLLNLTTFVF